MTIPRLYCPTLSQGPARLSEEESHHAIDVVRVKTGDEVMLFDGRGGQAIACVTRINRRQLQVDTKGITRHLFELPQRLTLAVAMPKIHRRGYLIEKCTELGVAAIWPIITKRGVTRPRPGSVEKWSRRAIEAAKQSMRAWVPHIEAPQTFDESLARISEFDATALTHADASASSFQSFLAAHQGALSILVWIGPEGGWTEAELDRAQEAGAVLTRLGPTVLRTETAAVAVCAAVALASLTETSSV